MDSERVSVKDKRDGFPIFIHSELDDYGLSPIEFRVYGRLARRAGQGGQARESIPNMAKEFEVSVRTIQYTLKLLALCGLISRIKRPGKTDVYSLNPRTVWKDKKSLKTLRQEIFYQAESGATTDSGATRERGATTDGGVVQSGTGVVVQPQIDEGYPSEGTPLEDIPSSLPKGSGTRKAAKPRDPNLDHPAVVLYRDICHITPNEQQRADIVAAGLNLDRYGGVLRKFMSEGQRPNRVDWTLERYQSNGNSKQNTGNRNPSESDFVFHPKSKVC